MSWLEQFVCGPDFVHFNGQLSKQINSPNTLLGQASVRDRSWVKMSVTSAGVKQESKCSSWCIYGIKDKFRWTKTCNWDTIVTGHSSSLGYRNFALSFSYTAFLWRCWIMWHKTHYSNRSLENFNITHNNISSGLGRNTHTHNIHWYLGML